jgi:hypothetical protein
MTTPERYEDTTDADNPPNSMVNPRTRKRALFWNLGLLAMVAVLAGVVAVFWLAAHPAETPEAPPDRVVGTSGYSTEGGHNAIPRLRNTKDELKFRGF